MINADLLEFVRRHQLSSGAFDELMELVGTEDGPKEEGATALSPPPKRRRHAQVDVATEITRLPKGKQESSAPASEESPAPIRRAPPVMKATRKMESVPTPPLSRPKTQSGRKPKLPLRKVAQERVAQKAAKPAPDLAPKLAAAPAPKNVWAQNPGTQTMTRYEDMGPLGEGGMGQVRRVLDRGLKRVMAMKVIRAELMQEPETVARFVSEAQTTAQLQHPGIVPVHEIGTMSDGRLYFTMQEIQGKTLETVIDEVHAASQGGAWGATADGWTLRRLVEVFRRACDAVGYAHGRGVLHRDMKPDNVMLGEHGSVLVLDWGISKIQTSFSDASSPLQSQAISTRMSVSQEFATKAGTINGTPAYMAPEQARGDTREISSRSDVYALGAILYQILSGQAPYVGPSNMHILFQVIKGPPEPLLRKPDPKASLSPVSADSSRTSTGISPQGLHLPEALVEICQRAMSREAEGRYEDASELAADVGAWLDGENQREKALELLERSKKFELERSELEVKASLLKRRANAMLAGLEPWRSDGERARAWRQQDEGMRLEREADLRAFEAEQLLNTALSHAPEMVELHAGLARRYEQRHRDAEAAQEQDVAATALLRLRAHVSAIPEEHSTHQRLVRYLRGDGRLTLTTSPEGAEVFLYRYESYNRRLMPVFKRSLGRTPLVDVSLEMGSYLLVLRREGFEDVHYPVLIEREGHWTGVAPGTTRALAVALPMARHMSEDEVYVPGGWFWSGAINTPGCLNRRRHWVEPFVVKRTPVTNGEYITFLNHLLAQGRTREALLYAPREGSRVLRRTDELLYVRGDDGLFQLEPQESGVTCAARAPVVLVDWEAAVAYTRWLTQVTGQPWRLPTELEWEKAARGVDGRAYPWGNHFEACWCCVNLSHQGPMRIASVDEFEVDCSPYGVRAVAGNVQEWCADFWEASPEYDLGSASVVRPKINLGALENPLRVHRGGAWNFSSQFSHLAHRLSSPTKSRHAHVGFRPVRSLNP